AGGAPLVVIMAAPRRVEPETHGRRGLIERQGIGSAPDGFRIDPQVVEAGGLLRRRAKRVADVRACAEERIGREAVDRVRERRQLSKVEAQQARTGTVK